MRHEIQNEMTQIKRALISVSMKQGIAEFALALSKFGIEIISTGGTAKVVREAGVPVTEVSDYTGFPEILDGRVKTLHPKIHGGILCVRDNADHVKELSASQIEPIDLVIVNFYPFQDAISKPSHSFDDAIENIDIGGPALLRAAAKNHQYTAVVCDPDDYSSVIKELEKNKGMLSNETRFELAKKAFAYVAVYDCAIAEYLGRYDKLNHKVEFPSFIGLAFNKSCDLRYGENPHQKAALYKNLAADTSSIVNAQKLHGKELSYNNIVDADSAVNILSEFSLAPFAAVIVKHTNPCGVALSDKSLSDAFAKALTCDPVSAFGGIIALSQMVDDKTAKLISEGFFELTAAPSFDSAALKLLCEKKNIRLLEIPPFPPFTKGGGGGFSWTFRKVSGGLLLQECDLLLEDVRQSKVVSKRAPTEDEWKNLVFAWRVCKHVKSNAIVFAADEMTVGIGAGQTSRVDAVKLAARKMNELKTQSSKIRVVASDAFFPFRDGVDEAAKAQATAVIEPGGSIRDEEVIQAADEHNMAMVVTGIRHFHH